MMVALASCAGLVGCQSGAGLKGGVKLADEKLSSSQPVSTLKKVYIANFELDTAIIQTDNGIGGVADTVSGHRSGPLARLGILSQSSVAQGDASEQAPRIVNAMAEDVRKSFLDKGIPAERITDTSGVLPNDGWLLTGKFTQIDEGNRAQRAAIGFGMGASQMAVQVNVSDLASAKPRQAFIALGTTKDPGMMPGAAYNPYAMAAKFVIEKGATDKDIQGTAELIATEITNYKDKSVGAKIH